MRITADTNLIVRILVEDDLVQVAKAEAALREADLVAITTSALCEAVWVLGRGYGLPKAEIAEALRRLVDGARVATRQAAVEAGLAMLEAGGDFADGVIAFEGEQLGGDTFLSFDRRAVKLLTAQGRRAQLLG